MCTVTASLREFYIGLFPIYKKLTDVYHEANYYLEVPK